MDTNGSKERVEVGQLRSTVNDCRTTTANRTPRTLPNLARGWWITLLGHVYSEGELCSSTQGTHVH